MKTAVLCFNSGKRVKVKVVEFKPRMGRFVFLAEIFDVGFYSEG